MSSHDPLCPFQDTHQPCAGCGLIAQADLRARADEDEKIAQAIEAKKFLSWSANAQIARNGGRDD